MSASAVALSRSDGLRVAVIGTGISGNLAARLLASRHDVHVFEANDYIGGHTNTVDLVLAGRHYAIDTGFMVFNERTYPNFTRLLRLLGVKTRESEMSFSVRCERSGLEYQGSSLNGLFAQRRNLLNPRFYRMVQDVLRFNVQSREVFRTAEPLSLGEYLSRRRYGREFVDHYLLPMSAAIWSCRPGRILEFPARFLVGFFQNHGLLQIRNRPQWKTVTGGARNYVDRLIAPFRDRIRLNRPVQAVTRHANHVVVQSGYGSSDIFDHVVFASHADQTLEMLTDADATERKVLGAFPYQSNDAVLHTDLSLLPRRRRAWASWNYHIPRGDDGSVCVTYDLNRLQRCNAPHPILLTLNSPQTIDPSKVLCRFSYDHPAFGHDSIAAQQRHAELNGRRRTFYCGAYWGYGFHEDGVNSALAVSKCFGIGLESCTAAFTRDESPITASAR